MSVPVKKRNVRRLKLNVVTFAMILRELQTGPTSATDLVNLTGYGRHTVVGYLRTLHAKSCIHITDYELDAVGRQRSPVYALGEGRDKPRRKPQPFAVTNARYRERRNLRELQERLAA